MTELLADHTTLRVGGPAGAWAAPETETELVDLVAAADIAAQPVLILGGGSNLLVCDAGFPGLVVHTGGLRGVEEIGTEDGWVRLRVAAGEQWDEVVARTVASGLAGIEALSGIPGLAGATPVQNVGAYGQEVSQVIAEVRAYDRAEREIVNLLAPQCRFGYRNSRFKQEPGRWVVLAITLRLKSGGLSAPVRYGELARVLGLELNQRTTLAQVRQAVLDLRRSKGMVLDLNDPDTWSAGSFFTNPVLTPEQAGELPTGAPTFVQPDGSVKTSAAWLIEHSGLRRGHAQGLARISAKHVLALTNSGGATAADLVALARTVRDEVLHSSGVRLEPEPVLIGISLDP